jgi:diamine N-acetyltransferase
MTVSPFQGKTITLRPFEPDDGPALATYLNHPDLAARRCIPWGFPDVAPLSQQQAQAIIQRWSEGETSLHQAIVRVEDHTLIGHVDCDWEWDPHQPALAVVIAPDCQRQGYGSEALRSILCYLFGYTPAHNVSSWIADWNEAARQFAAHHHFQESGRMRRVGIRQGRTYDLVVADLLRPEWQRWGGEHDAA